MKLAGSGYIGLVAGTCFAEVGIQVVCIDIDEKKIDNVHKSIMPIYMTGLEEMVLQTVSKGRLHSSTNLSETIQVAEGVFIAVGTPPR